MKRFSQHIILLAALISSISFIACDDDNENQLNEWNMSYVSLLQADYLRPVQVFTLKHILDKGIEDKLEDYQVIATLQKPASQDVTVNISATCEGIAQDKIVMSSRFALIKAGEIQSVPVSISITDWSDIESIEEAEYTLDIKIASIETIAPEVTNAERNQSIAVKIKKEQAKPEELLFYNQVPENSELYTNVTDWIFTFMDGVENQNANSVAGTGGSDVATNGVPFWVSIDFKEVKTVTGIYTTHWGGAYAPTKVEILISDNGSTWKSMGEVATGAVNRQTIAFKNPTPTRYLRYQMIDVPGRVDIMKLHVYMAK